MQPQQKSVHYYHANASAFGGYVERPYHEPLETVASLSLSPVGGYAHSRHEKFRYREIISIESAYTHVAGTYDHIGNGYTTQVKSVVEGLNVNNIFFADRVACHIHIDHNVNSEHPKVNFIGSHYDNLRIGSCKITPVLDLDICQEGDGTEPPKQPPIENPRLLKHARAHAEKMDAHWNEHAKDKHPRYKWLERFDTQIEDWEKGVRRKGLVITSVVKDIEGSCGGTKFGHTIDIPEFGKVILGELIVDRGTFNLTMIRFELGCGMQLMAHTGNGSANGSNAGGG